MNYFTERLNTLIKGIQNWDNVLESRYNALKRDTVGLSPAMEAEADRRLSICLECPFNSVNARTSAEYKAITGEHYQTTRSESHCAMCSCPITYKVLAMNDCCGLNYWNNANPGKYVPLKWLAFNP